VSQNRARIGNRVRRPGEHRRIAIQADQFSVGSDLFEDQFAMTAAADRAIDYNESRPNVEELQNFPDEDGTVYGRARIAGRRRIGHCVWRKKFDWEGATKTGKEN
jgi:hypothetical protein